VIDSQVPQFPFSRFDRLADTDRHLTSFT
jgi:hypothetical protein